VLFRSYLIIATFKLDDVVDAWNEGFYGLFGLHGAPRQFLGDYLVATVVTINLLAARNALLEFSVGASTLIQGIASYSFSCYLYHLPIYTVLLTLFGRDGRFLPYLFKETLALALIVLLGHYTEHKKGWYRAQLKGWFPGKS
jgi:peptidoglycan/LPS O-acetylase OafA/YrhL